MDKIKRPVEVVETQREYSDGCGEQESIAYIVDRDGDPVPGAVLVDYGENSLSALQQIADALNATGDGSWSWACREMMANDLQPFTYGMGRHHYRHNWGKFEISDEAHKVWRDVELIDSMVKATDWRRA